MTRRCSHCSNNGHNSRTCPTRGGSGAGVKLFGVRLTDGLIIKKSASMGNLSAHYHSSSAAAASPNPGSPSSDPFDEPVHVPNGYVSDDLAHASSSSNRRSEPKKGVPWTEDEHRLFLLGLQKLGKGDWRGISRNYVTSRTPTQVASHAQKYFIRQSNVTRRKRRSSLFDMVTDPPPLPEEQTILPPQPVEIDRDEGNLPPQPVEIDRDEGNLPPSQSVETDHLNFLPSLDLSLKPDYESMPTNSCGAIEKAEENLTAGNIPSVIPSILPAYFPAPFPMWPSNVSLIVDDKGAEASDYEVIKPIPVIPTQPVNVDELVGMSQLSLRENGTRHIEPSPLSLKLLGEPSRQSAFHVSAPASGSGRTKGDNSSSNSSSRVEAA